MRDREGDAPERGHGWAIGRKKPSVHLLEREVGYRTDMTRRRLNERCIAGPMVLYTPGLGALMTTRMMQATSGQTLPVLAAAPSRSCGPGYLRPAWLGLLHRAALALLAVFVCIGITSSGYAESLREDSESVAGLDEREWDGAGVASEPAHQLRESHQRAGVDLEVVEFDLDDDTVADSPILGATDFIPLAVPPRGAGSVVGRHQVVVRSRNHRVGLPRGPPSGS